MHQYLKTDTRYLITRASWNRYFCVTNVTKDIKESNTYQNFCLGLYRQTSYEEGDIRNVAMFELGVKTLGDVNYFGRHSSFWFQVSKRMYLWKLFQRNKNPPQTSSLSGVTRYAEEC